MISEINIIKRQQRISTLKLKLIALKAITNYGSFPDRQTKYQILEVQNKIPKFAPTFHPILTSDINYQLFLNLVKTLHLRRRLINTYVLVEGTQAAVLRAYSYNQESLLCGPRISFEMSGIEQDLVMTEKNVFTVSKYKCTYSVYLLSSCLYSYF